ncbi:ankyrin repeat domain-containing protein [Verrucomicrobia bacterium]|nr:ankyrin repeat domain-containing protein [Verrucomicrobiota bacterium]
MKHILLTTIAAVVLVGCGPSQPPKPPTAKAPDISIHDAALIGNIEAVKQHLAAGTDVNAKDEEEWTPLLYAASEGHKEIVELLITEGADVNAKDVDEWTPLHWAVNQGHKETAELLLAKGADVNAKIKLGSTPLHRAAYKGHKEIVELLIDNGADVNAERHETFKITPIREAALSASETTYKTYLEIMSILIAAGADVNAHGSGNTVLEEVIKLPELVELLIANGADVNTRGIRGRTPLDRAINKKSPETADLLRKHGGKTGEELEAEGK